MPLFVNVINHNSVNVLRSIAVEEVLLTFIAEFDEFIFLKHEPICLFFSHINKVIAILPDIFIISVNIRVH